MLWGRSLRERLRELDIRNVKIRQGDGTQGWSAQAPFEAILMAAAPLAVWRDLLERLAPGDRLMVPVGPDGEPELMRFTRREEDVTRASLGRVAFVPLLGGKG